MKLIFSPEAHQDLRRIRGKGRTGVKRGLRTRYVRYVGQYVIHCHILPHEDLGMMQVVEVVPPTTHIH